MQSPKFGIHNSWLFEFTIFIKLYILYKKSSFKAIVLSYKWKNLSMYLNLSLVIRELIANLKKGFSLQIQFILVTGIKESDRNMQW